MLNEREYMLKELIKNAERLTGRFAAMAGVARRTIKRELHRYCLVARRVETRHCGKPLGR
jgi:hypothetical protein